jgi:hypothetical protein
VSGADVVSDESVVGTGDASGGGSKDEADEFGKSPTLVTTSTVLIGYDQKLLVTTSGSTYGEDDEGSNIDTTVTLQLFGGAANGLDSGLDTTDGTSILLYNESGVIVGRAGGSTDEAIFAISTDKAGLVTLEQYASIFHNTVTSPSSYDELTALEAQKIEAKVTVTDGDKDVDTDTIDISASIKFEDDGPATGVENLVGSGTSDPQFGTWSASFGADGPYVSDGRTDPIAVTINSFTIGSTI